MNHIKGWGGYMHPRAWIGGFCDGASREGTAQCGGSKFTSVRGETGWGCLRLQSRPGASQQVSSPATITKPINAAAQEPETVLSKTSPVEQMATPVAAAPNTDTIVGILSLCVWIPIMVMLFFGVLL